MIIYIQLFFEFFKTGLFAVGGGLATLPFLTDIADKYSWFDKNMLADMIAVSQSTPGPMGINMATYAGYNAKGIVGALIATFALVLPSFIIIIIVSNFLEKFKESKIVSSIFYTLRPAVTGLIAVALFEIIKISILNIPYFIKTKSMFNILNYKALILAILIFIISKVKKKHPIFLIALGAFGGIIMSI